MYILLYQELFITVETTSVPDFDILESFLSDFGNLPGNRCGNENVSNVGEGVAEPLGGVFLNVWHQVAHERTARVYREPNEQEETQTMREIRSHIHIAPRVHLKMEILSPLIFISFSRLKNCETKLRNRGFIAFFYYTSFKK